MLGFSEVEEYNRYLDKLSSTIADIEKRFSMDKIAYSSAMVIEKLSDQKKSATKKENPSNILFDFMQKYIDDHSSSRTAGSLSVYKSVKNHIQDYCEAAGKKNLLTILTTVSFSPFKTS